MRVLISYNNMYLCAAAADQRCKRVISGAKCQRKERYYYRDYVDRCRLFPCPEPPAGPALILYPTQEHMTSAHSFSRCPSHLSVLGVSLLERFLGVSHLPTLHTCTSPLSHTLLRPFVPSDGRSEGAPADTRCRPTTPVLARSDPHEMGLSSTRVLASSGCRLARLAGALLRGRRGDAAPLRRCAGGFCRPSWRE